MEELIGEGFPWNALIWFIAASAIVIIMEMKGEALKEQDPETFPKRRMALLVFSFIIASLNMAQVAMRVQLIDFFNYTVTAGLFFRFWFIEKGNKKKVARNMAIITFALALLSLLGILEYSEAFGLEIALRQLLMV